MVPNGRARFQVTHFQLKSHFCDHRASRDLFEVVQPASDHEVTGSVAAPCVNSLIAARGSELAQEDLLNHLRRRFYPTLVFVRPHLFAIAAVDNAVFTIKMRSK